MNKLQEKTLNQLIENQFNNEEKKFINNLLSQCYFYFNDEQRKLSASINAKLNK